MAVKCYFYKSTWEELLKKFNLSYDFRKLIARTSNEKKIAVVISRDQFAKLNGSDDNAKDEALFKGTSSLVPMDSKLLDLFRNSIEVFSPVTEKFKSDVKDFSEEVVKTVNYLRSFERYCKECADNVSTRTHFKGNIPGVLGFLNCMRLSNMDNFRGIMKNLSGFSDNAYKFFQSLQLAAESVCSKIELARQKIDQTRANADIFINQLLKILPKGECKSWCISFKDILDFGDIEIVW